MEVIEAGDDVIKNQKIRLLVENTRIGEKEHDA